MIAYGPADATASLSSLASLKSRMVLTFWCQLTQVDLEKRPLSGCLSVFVFLCTFTLCYNLFSVDCLSWLYYGRPM